MGEIGQPEPSRAGAVVYRPADAGPEVLLVTATGKDDEWVLPKGHIEAGEDPEATAVREIREEAGIEIEIVRRLCGSVYVHGGEIVSVVYFLARAAGYAVPSEQRRTAWVAVDEAVNLLAHDENRNVMRRAKEELGVGRDPQGVRP